MVLDAPKGNVLTGAMMEALGAALAQHAQNPRLQLVLLAGAGAHFSFGASVEEHQPAQAPAMLASFHRLIRAVAAHPVPIAAWVRGSCLGGAFELALACHFVFVAPEARLGCPEIKLGVFPPVLAAIGPLRLGQALSERLLLTGATLSAAEAVQSGFAQAASSDDEVLTFFRTHLSPLSAFALRQGVRASRRGSGLLAALDGPLAALEQQYLAEVVPSHDGVEGIAAFLARRTPVWADR